MSLLIDETVAVGGVESATGGAERHVSFDEMFDERFMRTHTDGFDSFEAFLAASGWSVDSIEDFERIPRDEFDEYVSEQTVFKDWESMLSTAAKRWAARQTA